MRLEDFKKLIIQRVEDLQGCKALKLLADRELINVGMSLDGKFHMPDILDEMLAEGSIIEIEYTLPSMPNRIKSFYLPKGTCIQEQGGVWK